MQRVMQQLTRISRTPFNAMTRSQPLSAIMFFRKVTVRARLHQCKRIRET